MAFRIPMNESIRAKSKMTVYVRSVKKFGRTTLLKAYEDFEKESLTDQESEDNNMEETNYIRQFGVDILDDGYSVTENLIIEALEAYGLIVEGCMWKASWTEEGYHKGEPPIDSD